VFVEWFTNVCNAGVRDQNILADWKMSSLVNRMDYKGMEMSLYVIIQKNNVA